MTRVLHVDDESVILDKVRQLLEPHFEWMGSVQDGGAVLDVVTKLRPDVVLLDISLPGRSGFEVARASAICARAQGDLSHDPFP